MTLFAGRHHWQCRANLCCQHSTASVSIVPFTTTTTNSMCNVIDTCLNWRSQPQPLLNWIAAEKSTTTSCRLHCGNFNYKSSAAFRPLQRQGKKKVTHSHCFIFSLATWVGAQFLFISVFIRQCTTNLLLPLWLAVAVRLFSLSL